MLAERHAWRWRPGWPWAWALPAGLLACVALLLGLTDRWTAVRIRSLGTFADLAQVTHNADCPLAVAGDVGNTACDPLGRAYNYPPIWAGALRVLGVGGDDTVWFGLLLVTVALGLLTVFYAAFLGEPRRTELVLLIVATVSPPFLLMLARANTDLLVLAVLSAVALLLRTGAACATIPLLAAASGLKIYAIGAVIAQSRSRTLAVSAVLSAVAVATLAVPHLPEIRDATPSRTGTSFGAGVLPALIRRGYGSVSTGDQVLGLAAVTLLVGLVLAVQRTRALTRAAAAAIGADGGARCAVMLGAGPFLFAYLLTTSFDYRMNSLVLLIAGCLIARRAIASRALDLLLGLSVGALWLSFVLPRPGQAVGDVVVLVLVVYLAAVVLLLFVVRERWPSPYPPDRLVEAGSNAQGIRGATS